MQVRKLTVLILTCCSLMLGVPVKAGPKWVKVKFEVDGAALNEQFKVIIYAKELKLEPDVVGSTLAVPPELKDYETVDVRFLCGKYDLFFEDIHTAAFDADWIVGVDNKPFDKENTDSEEPIPPGKELLGIYYIHFVSRKGLDTRVVFRVYK